MKKTLLAVWVSLLCFVASAQVQPTCHHDFEGIPINGSLGEFGAILEEHGFALLKIDKCHALASGSLAGNDDVMLVCQLNGDGNVMSVSASILNLESSKDMVAKIISLSEYYSVRYGKPVEEIMDGLSGMSDSEAVEAVKNTEYGIVFAAPCGIVSISPYIRENTQARFGVSVTYLDRPNSECLFPCNCLRFDEIPVLKEYDYVQNLLLDKGFKLVSESGPHHFWMGNVDKFGSKLVYVQCDDDNFMIDFRVQMQESETLALAIPDFNAVKTDLASRFAFHNEEPLPDDTGSATFSRILSQDLWVGYQVKRPDGNIVSLRLLPSFIDDSKISVMIQVFDN